MIEGVARDAGFQRGDKKIIVCFQNILSNSREYFYYFYNNNVQKSGYFTLFAGDTL